MAENANEADLFLYKGNSQKVNLEDFKNIQVYIYCNQKSGSTTLLNTLKQYYNCMQVHYNDYFKFHTGADFSLFDCIEQSSNNFDNIYVIDVYRTPIERAISAFFEEININLPNFKNIDINELIEIFNTKFLCNQLYEAQDEVLNYYKLEKPIFNFEKGYSTINHKNIHIIKLRFNDINKWQNILNDIFKIPINIINGNLSENKSYSDVLQNFKKLYKVPKYFIDNIKSSWHFNNFNNKDEIIDYLNKWQISNNLDIKDSAHNGLQYHMEEAIQEQIKILQSFISNNRPNIAIYGNEYYSKLYNMRTNKIYDYCWIGSISSDISNRMWVIEWFQKHATEKSIFICTDKDWKSIGFFDKSEQYKDQVFNPKIQKDNWTKDVQYRKPEENEFYFSTMSKSKYILCPAGDSPWSFRYYETIICGSIPIVQTWNHTYRTEMESKIKWNYFLQGEHIQMKLLNDIDYNNLVKENDIMFKKNHLLEFNLDKIKPIELNQLEQIKSQTIKIL